MKQEDSKKNKLLNRLTALSSVSIQIRRLGLFRKTSLC